MMRRVLGISLTFALMLVACSHPKTYSAQASIDPLTASGWGADLIPGRGNTLSGLPQVAYLELRTPISTKLVAQFMEDPASAQKENDAIHEKFPDFMSEVIGNVVVFVPPKGDTPVAPEDLTALESLLL
jgi:hypothetical protein